MGKLKKKTLINAALIGFSALSISPTLVKANVDLKPAGMTVIGAKGVSSYTRKVATAIGIYSKNGVLPGVTKKDITFAGVKVHVLEVDATDKNGTFVQVDYAGKDSDDTPKFLNNFYDKDLTRNDEYRWVGATNAGFFNSTSSSNMYGYPTGAVKINGTEQTYRSSGTGNEDWNCSPAYGNGFVTLHLNKNKDMKLIYNGWKGGQFYKFAGDTDANSWDYGEYLNYQDAVSGAYTLKVDGQNKTWGKGDYTSTDYWNYKGTGVTLFGQKENGNYVLVTTEAAMTAPDQQALMSFLECTDAIRFDGGGSTQMAFDKGLILDHYYMSKTKKEFKQGEPLNTDDIGLDLYMEDGSYHWATPNDAPQIEYLITNANGEIVNDLSKAPVGTYRFTTMMNGLEQSIDLTVVENKHTVIFQNHEGKVIHTETVKDGEDVTCPISMERKGYTFDGWDADLTNITGDITVHPIYTAVPYKLTLDLAGGTAENPTQYTIEDEFVVNNPTKAGHRFIGWEKVESSVNDSVVADDKKLQANGTDESQEDDASKVGDIADDIEDKDSSAAGKGADGSTLGGDTGSVGDASNAEDRNVSTDNGGTDSAGDKMSSGETSASVEDTNKAGDIDNKISDKNASMANDGNEDAKDNVSDKETFARDMKLREEVDDKSVGNAFGVDDATSAAQIVVQDEVDEDQANDNQTGTLDKVDKLNTVETEAFQDKELIMDLRIAKGTTGDLHYVANYVPLSGSINYRFDIEGVVNDNPATFTPGQEFTLNEPSANGYRFIGWYIDGNPAPDGKIPADAAGDIEVYGKFELIKYDIRFDDPNVQTIQFDITQLPIQLPTPAPQDGLRFDGWYKESNFSGEKLTQVTEIGSIDLYGKWVADVSVIKSITARAKTDNFFVGQMITPDMFIVETIDNDGNHLETQEFTIEGGESLVEGDNVLTFRYKELTCELTVKARPIAPNPSGDQMVELVAHKASAYTVTLPKIVDATNEEVQFDIKVKGDITGDERLVVSVDDGYLRPVGAVDQSKDIVVTADLGGGKSYTYIHNEIKDENIKKVTLRHASLDTGVYEGSLSVNIEMQKGK